MQFLGKEPHRTATPQTRPLERLVAALGGQPQLHFTMLSGPYKITLVQPYLLPAKKNTAHEMRRARAMRIAELTLSLVGLSFSSCHFFGSKLKSRRPPAPSAALWAAAPNSVPSPSC